MSPQHITTMICGMQIGMPRNTAGLENAAHWGVISSGAGRSRNNFCPKLHALVGRIKRWGNRSRLVRARQGLHCTKIFRSRQSMLSPPSLKQYHKFFGKPGLKNPGLPRLHVCDCNESADTMLPNASRTRAWLCRFALSSSLWKLSALQNLIRLREFHRALPSLGHFCRVEASLLTPMVQVKL